jgi:cellulose synthase/poly-beta-1,6-N-acetylglucosamine synthase-like glycosyltransferase
MSDALAAAVIVAYLAIVIVLSVHGLNFLRLTRIALRDGERRPAGGRPGRWPSVAVQLPIYNERYVAADLIDAVATFDYPGKLEIQVLDDSTDDTAERAAAAVARWSLAGVRIRHLRRPDRRGYKAGALAAGLAATDAELVAIFDADFRPDPDFLTRTVPILVADPGLAFVQARWDHGNPRSSMLSRVQAMAIDGHFAIEQQGRWAAGDWFNFNGTAGVWRRAAIEEAGGWQSDTLTEDLDLSYRTQLRGWRGAFDTGTECVAELPVGFGAYRRQQARWARGSLECAAKYASSVLRAPASVRQRAGAMLHLTGYSIHLLLLAMSLLYPILILALERFPGASTPMALLGLVGLPALAPAVLFLGGQHLLGRLERSSIPTLLLLTLVGVGMMANTARAWGLALRGRPGVFERTPKFGRDAVHGGWQRLRYQVGPDPIVLAELGLAVMDTLTVRLALARGDWAIAAFAGLFAAGLALVAGLSIHEWARRALLHGPAVAATSATASSATASSAAAGPP